MDAAERFLAALESAPPASSSHHAHHSSTQPSHYFQREGYVGHGSQFDGLSPLKGDFSSNMTYMGDDAPLDDFDRELLAEQSHERQWRASRGMTRLSLPSTASTRSPPFFSREGGDVSEASPARRLLGMSSSSSSHPVSSPTIRLSKAESNSRLQPRNQVYYDGRPQASGATLMTPLHGPHHTSSDEPIVPMQILLGHAPPIVQGISLLPKSELPDRFSSLYDFPLFNAVQSRTFKTAFGSDENLVVSAPTGSGKTVIMELAIFRLMHVLKQGDFKIVYQAPTKSLCSERYRDWNEKFGKLDLKCAELTGDTPHAQLKSVQSASIIITTPEKWDSVTRKWRDHIKLMQMIKLFLIDEVHILKDSRGATLEAVVSRMKSVGSNVRFVALSATVPNPDDVAAWLGKDSFHPYLPAHSEVFGEEFRPVQLEKHVYGYPSNGNGFAFDKMLDSKLLEVIAKHAQRRPILIFCCTRKSCEQTAKNLAESWSNMNETRRLWKPLPGRVKFENSLLDQTVRNGVAFHHAGVSQSDRTAIEKMFLKTDLSIICCTSTLAVGVNLPCYLVVIKGTSSYTDKGMQEYPDLEMTQMLGRAGRPQFESSAVAVILTRQEKTQNYKKLIGGEEKLESCLHLNLIDHLNAEIGLGTISDLASAKRWLAGTFLFVRLQCNPGYYRLKEVAEAKDEKIRLEQICAGDIKLLKDNNLVADTSFLKSTAFGEAMARYYIKFETMQGLMSLPSKAKMSEMISVIAQAAEFQDFRFRPGEKSLFKEVNRDSSIKYPIKVDITVPAHKVSLLLQAELGGMDYPTNETFGKHKYTFIQDKIYVLQNINRLIRCIIDCQIERNDAVGARHALELARSFSARVWDNSPLQLKQLEGVGNVAVRKLANVGINSIEALEAVEAHRIEAVLVKNPPFGMKLLSQLERFPKLRVSAKIVGTGKQYRQSPVSVKIKAEIGFLNEKPPLVFQRRPVYVSFLAELSDGTLVDFRRMHAEKVRNGHEIILTPAFSSAMQWVTCYVMCDEVAGTLRSADVKPDLPPSLFPAKSEDVQKVRSNVSNSRGFEEVDFGDDDLEDADLLAADTASQIPSHSNTMDLHHSKASSDNHRQQNRDRDQHTWMPSRLENGKWKCNHPCKDKTSCKHLCCREGLDKRPKPPKGATTIENRDLCPPGKAYKAVDSISLSHAETPFKKATSAFERRSRQAKPAAMDAQSLSAVHGKTGGAQSTRTSSHKLAVYPHKDYHEQRLSYLLDPSSENTTEQAQMSSDFDADWLNDLEVNDLPHSRMIIAQGLPQDEAASDNEFGLSDPEIESYLENISDARQNSPASKNYRRKRGGDTEDDADDFPHHPNGRVGIRKKAKISADFLFEDDDFTSSDTIGPDLERSRATCDVELPKSPEILPSNSTEALGTSAACGLDLSDREGRHKVSDKSLAHSAAKNSAREHFACGKQPEPFNTLRDVPSVTSRGESRSEDDEKDENEIVRKEREQMAKWEGFDPAFIEEFKDVVELID